MVIQLTAYGRPARMAYFKDGKSSRDRQNAKGNLLLLNKAAAGSGSAG